MSGWIDLELVTKFELTPAVLNETYEFLRDHGSRHREARALWAGRPTADRTFRLDTLDLPAQRNSALTTFVAADEISRAQDRLAHARRILACQVHTHPADPWHTDVDDDNPIVTQWGSLSLVIPNYAREPPGDLTHCALYRLGEKGWTDVTRQIPTLLWIGTEEQA